MVNGVGSGQFTAVDEWTKPGASIAAAQVPTVSDLAPASETYVPDKQYEPGGLAVTNLYAYNARTASKPASEAVQDFTAKLNRGFVPKANDPDRPYLREDGFGGKPDSDGVVRLNGYDTGKLAESIHGKLNFFLRAARSVDDIQKELETALNEAGVEPINKEAIPDSTTRKIDRLEAEAFGEAAKEFGAAMDKLGIKAEFTKGLSMKDLAGLGKYFAGEGSRPMDVKLKANNKEGQQLIDDLARGDMKRKTQT